MTQEIVHVEASAFGLGASEARQVESVFKPMLEQMTALEDQYNDVLAKEVTEDVCAEARALRLQYVKIRTGTARIHKKAKAYYLAGGRFIDGWKNAQAFTSGGKEGELERIETHFVRMGAERIAKVAKFRIAALVNYGVDPATVHEIGRWGDKVFDNFLVGAKQSHSLKMETERQAEADRKAAVIAEQEMERLRDEELKRLRHEAAARERELEVERTKRLAAEHQAEAATREQERHAAPQLKAPPALPWESKATLAPKMTDAAYRHLLAALIHNDPAPCEETHKALSALGTKEAYARGHWSWIDAYHDEYAEKKGVLW